MKNIEKEHLQKLTRAVNLYLATLDDVMKCKECVERGKSIAKLSNFLEMANDAAKHFGLGISFRSKKFKETKS